MALSRNRSLDARHASVEYVPTIRKRIKHPERRFALAVFNPDYSYRAITSFMTIRDAIELRVAVHDFVFAVRNNGRDLVTAEPEYIVKRLARLV